MTTNPFGSSTSTPGHGAIEVSLLPPNTPVLRKVAYQYPLKLLAPAAINVAYANESHLVHTVFLLTYGGGLVGGDTISLNVSVAATTRLILLTQGSTKIFKSPSPDVLTKQVMTVNVQAHAALCYLPDPVQPFENSSFEQKQIYNLFGEDPSLCVCDWVCEGRPSRGEHWSFYSYTSRNELWLHPPGGDKRKPRLLLRDNVILNKAAHIDGDVGSRMDGLGIFGTLILRGTLFERLGTYFIEEFALMPRIGARQWDPQPDDQSKSAAEIARLIRLELEKHHRILWSAARTRGCVVVKFGAKEVEGARVWLRHMLREEGTVQRCFGEGALLCMK